MFLYFIFSALKYVHLFFVCVALEVVAPVQMRLNVPFLANESDSLEWMRNAGFALSVRGSR